MTGRNRFPPRYFRSTTSAYQFSVGIGYRVSSGMKNDVEYRTCLPAGRHPIPLSKLLMTKHNVEPRNLLSLKPKRAVHWEDGDNGLVVILLPKFRNKFLATWLLPMLSKQNFRIKLDAHGSFLWRQFDGSTRVEEMGARMTQKFGRDAEPVFDRINKFLRKLEREHFITLENGEEAGRER